MLTVSTLWVTIKGSLTHPANTSPGVKLGRELLSPSNSDVNRSAPYLLKTSGNMASVKIKPPTIQEISDADLEAEVKRRAAIKEAERKRLEEERQEREAAIRVQLFNAMSIEMVDALAPKHGRSSCSDEATANGFSWGGVVPRCNRCALLQMSLGQSMPDDLNLEISFVHAD